MQREHRSRAASLTVRVAVVALLLAVAGGIWQGSARVGLVVGASMWLAIGLGATWGAAFPLLLDRMGLDPAVSSSVFLTTMTDMLSFLLILGSASYFLLHWL
jgi:magnesium transporter